MVTVQLSDPCQGLTNNDAPRVATVSDQTQSHTAAEGDTQTTARQQHTPTHVSGVQLLLAVSGVSLSEKLPG